jgi:hypothetical protein
VVAMLLLPGQSGSSPRTTPSVPGGIFGQRFFWKNMAICVHASVFLLLEKIHGWAGRDFSRAVPETFAMVDGRVFNGHADGRGDVAIAHRGPLAGWLRVASRRSGRGSHRVNRSRSRRGPRDVADGRGRRAARLAAARGVARGRPRDCASDGWCRLVTETISCVCSGLLFERQPAMEGPGAAARSRGLIRTDGQRRYPWRNRRPCFGGNVGGNLA